MVRDLVPRRYTFPKAVKAALTRCSSSSSRLRSFWSWLTTDCIIVLGMTVIVSFALGPDTGPRQDNLRNFFLTPALSFNRMAFSY